MQKRKSNEAQPKFTGSYKKKKRVFNMAEQSNNEELVANSTQATKVTSDQQHKVV